MLLLGRRAPMRSSENPKLLPLQPSQELGQQWTKAELADGPCPLLKCFLTGHFSGSLSPSPKLRAKRILTSQKVGIVPNPNLMSWEEAQSHRLFVPPISSPTENLDLDRSGKS
jgi:hypothetical protein